LAKHVLAPVALDHVLAGQAVHALTPVLPVYDPMEQAVQVEDRLAPVVPEYVPDGQAVQASPPVVA
jgi:hypothetical protein